MSNIMAPYVEMVFARCSRHPLRREEGDYNIPLFAGPQFLCRRTALPQPGCLASGELSVLTISGTTGHIHRWISHSGW